MKIRTRPDLVPVISPLTTEEDFIDFLASWYARPGVAYIELREVEGALKRGKHIDFYDFRRIKSAARAKARKLDIF